MARKKQPKKSTMPGWDSSVAPGGMANDHAGISPFDDHGDDYDPDADSDFPSPDQSHGPQPKSKSSAVPVSTVLDTLAVYGDFFCVGEKAYWQRHASEVSYDHPGQVPSPDTWEAPIPVSGPAFKREVMQHFDRITPKSAKMKDVVAAAEDTAYRASHIPSAAFTHYVAETPESPAAFLFAVAPAVLVKITSSNIVAVRNGPDAGVLISLPPDFTPISWETLGKHYSPDVLHTPALHTAVLDDLPPPIATDGIHHNENRALLLAFWFGMFFTAATQGRPVMGIFGAYQSGKTVTARAMGKLFYGREFDVSGGVGGGRAVKDLVAEMSATPFAVRDDMNRQPESIVDTICQFATGAKVALSTFHETLAFESHRVTSNLVLTAHTPSWALRADLLSRMIPVRLSRPDPQEFHLTEADRYARVEHYRAAAFAQTFAVIHKAMQTQGRWVCRTRFEDWETWVRRCADVGGWHMLLESAFHRLPMQRVKLACDTDPWVASLYRVACEIQARREHEGDLWYTAADLYDYVTQRLGGSAVDPVDKPSASIIKSQHGLSSWLSRVNEQGGSVVEVMRGPLVGGSVTWSLVPRG